MLLVVTSTAAQIGNKCRRDQEGDRSSHKVRSCRDGVGGRRFETEDEGEEKVTNGEGRQIWKDDAVVEGSRRRETEEALRGAEAVFLRNKVGLLLFLLRRF